MNDTKGLKEVVVDSCWGALGTLLIFHILSYFLVDGLVSTYRNGFLPAMFLWFLVFIILQRETTKRIHAYLDKNSEGKLAFLAFPTTKTEKLKACLTVLLIIPAALLTFGWYPIQKQVASWWPPILLNIISLGAAWLSTKSSHTSLKMPSGGQIWKRVVFGLIFLGVGIKFPENFYTSGLVGLEVLGWSLIAWLLDTKLEKNKQIHQT